jgi:hypothetical protein
MNKKEIVPSIGMGATIRMTLDKMACTVIRVSPAGKTIQIQRDRIDDIYTGNTDTKKKYRYFRDPKGEIFKCTKRIDGKYRTLGANGSEIKLGRRTEFYDDDFEFLSIEKI